MQTGDDSCPRCKAPVPLDVLGCPKCGQPLRKQRLLGEILLDEGIVTREQLETALAAQKRRLGEILVEIGACKAEDLDRAIQMQKMGRTQAEFYRRGLRIALIACLLLVCALTFFVLNLEQRTSTMLRMEKLELSSSEVAEMLDQTGEVNPVEAMRSLSVHLNDPSVVPVLKQALRNENWYVQMYAAMLVKESHNLQFVWPLIPLLVNRRPVAMAAQEALEALTDQKLGNSPSAWRDWARSQNLPVTRGPQSK
jgi:hypothetical protein